MTTTTLPAQNTPGRGTAGDAGAAPPNGAQPAALEKVVIPVSGMTCAACQGRVQRTLGKTAGIVEANVNLKVFKMQLKWQVMALEGA